MVFIRETGRRRLPAGGKEGIYFACSNFDGLVNKQNKANHALPKQTGMKHETSSSMVYEKDID
jgi:hypothetical protein